MDKDKKKPIVGRNLNRDEVNELAVDKDLRPEHSKEVDDAGTDHAEYYGASDQSTPATGTTQSTVDDDEPVFDSDDVELNEIISGVTGSTPLQTRVIYINGKRVAFHIKYLSPRERNRLEGRKFRRTPQGTIEQLDPGVLDTVMLGWTLHECVRKKDGSPKWSIDELLGRPEKLDRKKVVIQERIVGLVEKDDPETEQMLYDLRDEVWGVNPRLDPYSALRELGLAGDLSADESTAG